MVKSETLLKMYPPPLQISKYATGLVHCQMGPLEIEYTKLFKAVSKFNEAAAR